MTPDERNRLISFLQKKMCAPCRQQGANPEHPGCLEAQELLEIVESEA